MRRLSFSRRCLVFVLVLVTVCLLRPSQAAAQSSPVLQVEDDHFKVGTNPPSFLTFVSYFDGMQGDLTRINNDFAALRGNGFDGVRIFANWQNASGTTCSRSFSPYAAGTTLFNANGTINSTMWTKLSQIVDLAHNNGLVIDLTMDKVSGPCSINDSVVGPVPVMCPTEYRTAIGNVTDLLLAKGAGNVFFDLGNERDLTTRATYIDAGEIQAIRNVVKSHDPNRYVMASDTETSGPSGAASLASTTPLDVIAYHDPRTPPGTTWYNNTTTVVNDLRNASGASRPSYLQEPQKYCPGSGLTGANFSTAVQNAKAAGAAAWTFHTEAGFDLKSSSFMSQLNLHPENDFVTTFKAPLDQNIGWGACGRILTPTAASVPAVGGGFSLTVTDGPSCSWSTAAGDPWISVSGSGMGNGTVSYSVTANPASSPRSGTFTVAGRTFTVTQAGTPPPTLISRGYNAVGDFSGDHRADIAEYYKAAAQYWIRLNNGNGTFQAPGTNWANGSLGSTSTDWEVLVADFDGDGKADYADRHIPSGNFWIHRNTGAGSFDPSNWAFGFTTGGSGWEALAGDVNGDGKADVIEHNLTTGAVQIRLNAGAGNSFTGPYMVAWTGQTGPDWRLIVADFNNDGFVDVADFHIPSGQFWAHLNNGSLNFSSTNYAFGTGFVNPVFTTIFGDFTGDGYADFADVNRQTGEFWVHENLHNGTFAGTGVNWGSGLFTNVSGFSLLGLPVTLPPQ